MTRLLILNDYLKTGQRWFEHWTGVPFNDHRFLPMLQWIGAYGNEITSSVPLCITEIGPGGGKYTYTVLHQLQAKGMPRNISYTIYGNTSELFLTERDAIRLIDKWYKRDKQSRVRTHFKIPKEPRCFITEIDFKMEDLYKLKSTGPHNNLILCLDSFHTYDKVTQEKILSFFRNTLAYSGTLIFSIPTRTQVYYADKLRINFQPLGVFHVNEMTYTGWTKGGDLL